MSKVFKRTWYVNKREVINGQEVIKKIEKYGWFVDFVHNGRRIRRRAGHTKAEAEKMLAKLQMDALNDKLGIEKHEEITVERLIAEYLEYSKANKSWRSYGTDVRILKNFADHFGKGLLVSRIGSREMEGFKQQRLKGVAEQTVNRGLNTILNMLRKAVDWQYRVDISSFSKVKKLKVKSRRTPRFLSLEEVSRLLQACRWFDSVRDDDKSSTDIYPLVFVALHTGLRKSELCNLQWPDVDLQSKRLTVQSSRDGKYHPKGYRPRVIDLTDEVVEVLARQKKRVKSDYVFPGRGGERLTDVRRALDAVLKVADIKSCGLHTLRHTFASHLVMAGVDLPTVQELMGHQDIKTTMIYSHLDGRHKREAVNRLPFARQNGTNMAQNQVSGIPAIKKGVISP